MAARLWGLRGPCFVISVANAAWPGAAFVFLLLAGPAVAQPSPRPLAILDVPFITQSEALCGGAAAAMVLRYWGERGVDAESFAHLVDRSAAGIRTPRLVEDLEGRGWNVVAVEGTEDLVSLELSRGRPVLTLIEDRPGTFHYVVIVAATSRAVVLHDPARAPFRVIDRERFARRWSSANRWMAVVVPGKSDAPPPGPTVLDAAGDSCSALLADGVRLAQANDLDAAERSLTQALACGGPAPLRELAGLRLLQRRWTDVSELAGAALAEDPRDAHAWELLATSRFVQNDPAGALEAWNRIDQPRVDLVAVGGLVHTRQRVVERLLAVRGHAVLTPPLFDLTTRRLGELPSALTTRLEFVPMSSGLAELRAHVVERPLVPVDAWSHVVLGLRAVARNEVDVSMGSFTGGGERVSAGWRFWPGRPRVSAEVVSPAPWGGLWGIDALGERQTFEGDAIPVARRAGVGMTVSSWINPWARLSLRGGLDAWDGLGSYGLASGTLRLAGAHERLEVEVRASGWTGSDRFATAAASARVRSTTARRGRVYLAQAGASVASALTPPDRWFAGDTGRTSSIPLRAHPLVGDAGLRVDQMGRRIGHASVEAQQWWKASVLAVGAAAFADAARVGSRLTPGFRADVDLGVGLRLGLPGAQGVFRLDFAKGLHDGATSVSFVYEP